MTEYICELTPLDSETWDMEQREEVVRCRDCRFCGRGMWGVETFPVCRRRHTFQVSYDGFCAWASRKESE